MPLTGPLSIEYKTTDSNNWQSAEILSTTQFGLHIAQGGEEFFLMWHYIKIVKIL